MVISYLSDMADKKKKVANSFRNTSYKNNFSEAGKSIERWAMDALKSKKEKDKVFHCNDLARVISESTVFQEGKLLT